MSSHSDNSMDEVQFNASLDALLAGETLNVNDGSPTGNTYAALSSQPAHTWLTTTSGTSEMTNEMNLLQPSDPSGLTPLPLHAQHVNPSSTNYYASYLSYGSIGDNAQKTHPPVPSTVDTVSVTSSRSGGRTARSGSKSKRRSFTSTSGKHSRDASNSVSEDEGERLRRREDRNAREQQRSQKITEQIEHLRDVLVSANVQFKPDKYSTLVTAAEYIQRLQERSAMLDIEHKKLVDTISRTNELANDQYMSTSTTGANPPGTTTLEGTTCGSSDQKDAFYLSSIDYKSIFEKCGVPLAVLSIDGRFLECNAMFERLTGCTRDELLPSQRIEADRACPSSSSPYQVTEPTTTNNKNNNSNNGLGPPAPRNMSLFNLLCREHMEQVFMAMSEMLRQSPDEVSTGSDSKVKKDFWSGVVALARTGDVEVRFRKKESDSHHVPFQI